MDTCAVEVGLLKKKACGQNAVAKCANCEMALCSKHAVAQLTAAKTRTGKFMCAECHRADRTVDTTPTPPAKPAGAPAAAPKPAATPAQAAAPKPAAPAPRPAVTPAQAGAAKAAEKPKEPAKEEKFKLEDTGPIEFTPTKKP